MLDDCLVGSKDGRDLPNKGLLGVSYGELYCGLWLMPVDTKPIRVDGRDDLGGLPRPSSWIAGGISEERKSRKF
jgi:hypothetical protein